MSSPEMVALLEAKRELDKQIALAETKMKTEAAVGATQGANPTSTVETPAEPESPTNPPVTMADIQNHTNIPTPNGVVAALQGKVGFDSVVGDEFKDKTTPQAECFSLEAGEQIHAYIRDITSAFGKMMVEVAHKDRISRRVDGAPIQSIIEFSGAAKNLLDLVHPDVLSDSTIDDNPKSKK